MSLEESDDEDGDAAAGICGAGSMFRRIHRGGRGSESTPLLDDDAASCTAQNTFSEGPELFCGSSPRLGLVFLSSMRVETNTIYLVVLEIVLIMWATS